MRTFFILLAFAICLPVEAQRVKENVKHKVAISPELLADDVSEKKDEAESKKPMKESKTQNNSNAKRK